MLTEPYLNSRTLFALHSFQTISAQASISFAMAFNTSKKGFRIKNLFRSRSRDRTAIPSSSLCPIASPCDSSTTNPALPGPDNEPPPNVPERQKLGFVLLTPVLPADKIDERSPDIIAIHGICGDPLKTWTHESGALWLRDFLPKDINGARVFSFGYDAEVALTKSLASLDDFARSLLNNIKLERDGKVCAFIYLRELKIANVLKIATISTFDIHMP
jgi:hypothetical protein